jgi:glycerol-3-phosphate acyltransferase PlsX
VDGVGLITHGSSDALAIENAIRRAHDAARAHATEEMAEAAGRAAALLRAGDEGVHVQQALSRKASQEG